MSRNGIRTQRAAIDAEANKKRHTTQHNIVSVDAQFNKEITGK